MLILSQRIGRPSEALVDRKKEAGRG